MIVLLNLQIKIPPFSVKFVSLSVYLPLFSQTILMRGVYLTNPEEHIRTITCFEQGQGDRRTW
jgi:hypothetical protein